jgi:DNA-binding CsgD family transcriptional regulator
MFKRHEPANLVNLLEALYDLEQSRTEWFRGVLKAAAVALDCGAGIGMMLYDISGGAPCVDAMDGVNLEARNFALAAALNQEPSLSQAIVASYRKVVCATLAELVPDPQMLKFMREQYARVGLQDQLMINGLNNHAGLGCVLFVFSRSPISLHGRERTLLCRIATHLAAAYRMQRRLECPVVDRTSGIEAVMTVDGLVAHAGLATNSKVTRRDLSEAVKAREWAKTGPARRDSQLATAAWKPLVAARWSLVDSYERNGLRYITARENAPAPTGVATLSQRERQVGFLAELGHSNKLIAYELGLAHSTVRVLLARAAVKMGARTRAELIRQLQALGPSPAARSTLDH